MIGIAQGDRSGSKPLCSPGVKFWLQGNGGQGATRTAVAGLSEGRGRYHFAALKGASAAGTSSIKHGNGGQGATRTADAGLFRAALYH